MYELVAAFVALTLAPAFDLAYAQKGSAKAPPSPYAAGVEATAKYRDAWLANSQTQVMALFSPDATILPGGMLPITGGDAIRAFWWPANGPTMTVVAMEQVVDDVIADVTVAVVRGHGSVRFVMGDAGQQPQTLRHNFVNVVRRQPNGSWLIVQRMWSDLR